MFAKLKSLFLASLMISLPSVAQSASQGPVTGQAVRISAFSGLPVPRFESLKYSAVHGRTGPSLEYPVAWRYERRGLPVMVVRETRDWRMVRDPSGDEVWMHERTLGGQPSVMIHGSDLVDLHRSSNSESRVVARMESGAIATLIGCEETMCEVYINHRRGWADKTYLWGAPGTAPSVVAFDDEDDLGDTNADMALQVAAVN
ncbi:SH3 domain-containing protein [Ponticaulis sp.]|uniref:SH3 domain-containing protein n=1 Tax=Ponticaulis sp. TaxID=2020902 RepID=UPI00262B7D88|nr:SH3 domain-containing protein [Ponticaulis sp.]MDF1679549.1 SH3 domain-containing protein [Ponticaulis sp.]